MKQLYRCDYCDFTGTEEEVEKHEANCPDNYTLKSCLTCKYKQLNSTWDSVVCTCGKDVPEKSYIKYCNKYERSENNNLEDGGGIGSIFGNLFGGVFKK